MTQATIGGRSARGFRPDIQGLRAIAVLAVVLYHAGVPFLPGGYVGVDVFFVISGFLITGHLLTGLERDGTVGLASFYARRARRILPASFLVLILSVVAALIWFPPLLMGEVWRGAVATALYVPNMLFAVTGTDYLAEATPSLFQHYWSLGIEEQFYLVWPLILLVLWRTIRSKRALFAVILAVVGLSFAACVWLTFEQQPYAFFLLPTRAWELGVGGVVAFALARRSAVLGGRAAGVVGWIGISGIVGSVVLFSSSTAFPGYWAAIPVASTALVILAGAPGALRGPTAALSLRPTLWLGAISYSLYLVHWPALIIPQTVAGTADPLPLWLTLLIAAACVPVAWLLFRAVETPARDAAWLTGARPRRTLLAAASGSIACVAIASGVFVYSETRPLTTDETVTAGDVTSPPDFPGFVPENVAPSLEDVSDDQPAIYEDGCHRDFESVDTSGCLYGSETAPRIALFGDSHAAHWFPALQAFAQANGYAIETFTKSSCPSVSVDLVRNGVSYTECSDWRDGVIERLNATDPDLVVISNYGSTPLPPASADDASRWEAALGATLDRLDVPTVVIADTPDLRETPSLCLSGSLESTEECGLPAEDALDDATRDAEVLATAERGVPLIDLTDYLCDQQCDPIIGSTIVYRDAHHLTATFSAQLAEPLGSALEDLPALSDSP